MIVRDSDIGVQVFMMKRSLRSSFGGIWVFPGGILEDQDEDISREKGIVIDANSNEKNLEKC